LGDHWQYFLISFVTMSFLYPSFLWALLALAIPIIIHLFNFRKTTQVLFSNNRFLREVKDATTAKRRLKHYLILFSRLLFLFFLIITFCQPIIPAVEQLGNGRSIVLYLDNSQSMSAQTNDESKGLEMGMSFTRNIVELFPPDTRYKLITNDFSPSSNSYKTKPEILDMLTQVRLSPVSRTFKEVADRIAQDRTVRAREVFWISDLQKSTQGSISLWDSTTKLHLVPIQFSTQSNVFVDTAHLENPFAAGGGKNVLHVKIRNDGDKDAERLNLRLTINNIQAATTSVTVPAKASAETSFDLSTSLSGLNEGKLSFNDFPIAFDNEFYMALNFTDKIRILEIRSSDPRTVVEKVFGNEEIFEFSSYVVSNFNYSLLSRADLVVINGLNSVDAPLAAALRGYLSESGSVIFFPGSMPDVVNLRSFLQLPITSDAGTAAQQELDKPDFSNPFFENVFEEKSVSIAMPRAVKVLNWGNDRSAILRFKNDQPFLSRFDQRGKLYVVATALQQGQTDFFNHALFVPVMYRIASSSVKNEAKLYYTLRESFINLRADSLEGEEPLRWIGEEEVVPSQRKLNDQIIFDLPKFSLTKGFYKIVDNRDTISLLAFNLDKAESLLDQYTGSEMKRLLGGGDRVTIFDVASEDAFSNEIKERYLGTPLWKYALILAIFFLLVEILLIRFLK
jgi:hypothetical protein